MNLGPFPFLVPVVARARAAFNAALHGAGIQHRGGGLLGPFHGQAQDHPQVMDHGFKDPGC